MLTGHGLRAAEWAVAKAEWAAALHERRWPELRRFANRCRAGAAPAAGGISPDPDVRVSWMSPPRRPGRPMQYQPPVTSANRVAAAPLGAGRTVMLFDTIEAAGSIKYTFLLTVFDDAKEAPVYHVAAEVNAMAETHGGGSHFLGEFNGAGHANLGSSDDWGDPRKFFPKALRMASERFGVPMGDEG